MLRYKALAKVLRDQIQSGALPAGQRIASIRQLATNHGISTATAVQACHQLEREGLLQARQRMGYFVCTPRQPWVSTVTPSREPAFINNRALRDLLLIEHSADILALHVARPAPSLLPDATLASAFARCLRRQRDSALDYAAPQGYAPLRQQIAQRYASLGVTLAPEEIIITAGAMEAITLALRAVTQPGDLVLVETPVYQGILQTLATLGLKVVELAQTPTGEFNLPQLKHLLQTQPVRAAVLVPNFSNPLGRSLDDSTKQALLTVCAQHGTVVIEDDVYGELAWDDSRPSPLRRWGTGSQVITCSSFSKSLSPGLRVGWIAAGDWTDQLSRAKFFSTVGNAALPQLALSDYLARHDQERRLRKLRRALGDNAMRMIDAIERDWPVGTRMGDPRGGLSLWIGLPEGGNAPALFHAALQKRIGITPGHVFSSRGDYADHVRLSCGLPWDENLSHAIKCLGDLVREQLGG